MIPSRRRDVPQAQGRPSPQCILASELRADPATTAATPGEQLSFTVSRTHVGFNSVPSQTLWRPFVYGLSELDFGRPSACRVHKAIVAHARPHRASSAGIFADVVYISTPPISSGWTTQSIAA